MPSSVDSGRIVAPGQRLGHADEYRAGPGTYVRGGRLYATLVGEKQVVPAEGDELPLLEVKQRSEKSQVPQVGSVVTTKVTSVNQRFAKVEILCVGDTPLQSSFRGLIRVQDIRATEKDKVEVYKCFRPGDIVTARVISLGDARSYYLATDANELGVIHALSGAGTKMVPISWCEMQDPASGIKEARKVAKVSDAGNV